MGISPDPCYHDNISYFDPKAVAKSYTDADIIQLGHWAAQECAWQRSGELSVAKLIDAVLVARSYMQRGGRIDVAVIKRLGLEVDPRNVEGFRTVPVMVGDISVTPSERVPLMIDRWVEWLGGEKDQDWDPTGAFRAFEEIHPFVDGNGRVGAIIYNWLNGTLHPGKLVFPPNVFGDPRRG